MRKTLYLLLPLQFAILSVFSQPLALLIARAQAGSTKASISKTQAQISRYRFAIYQSSYKPLLNFYGNVPVYNKDNFQVVQPDGSIKFLSRSQNNSSIGFSFSQPLTFSGGEISLNTDLNRFDDIKARTTQYNGTPVYIRLSQPVFGFNQFKWDKKTEPLRLEESKRTLSAEMANMATEIIKYYFDILEAVMNKDLAKTNLQQADTNYLIEKRRMQLGVSTEEKLLQIELLQLQSRQLIEQAVFSCQVAQNNLKSYLNANENFEVNMPVELPEINVSLQQAMEAAKQHRPEFLSFVRKKLEAQGNTARTKADKRQVNLTASYGLNKAAENLSNVYITPNDQQRFSIGFTIPVADWGRRKIKYAAALAEEKLIDYQNEVDEAAYITEISNLVDNIPLLKNAVRHSIQADTISQKKYSITNRLYQLGKAGLIELQYAQNERDNARRTYFTTVRNYWEAVYQLKKLTGINY